MSYISELRKVLGHRTIIMPCACLIIGNSKGEVLLQKRTDDGTWSYHGGAIEVDEEISFALKRELKEELNYDVQNYELLDIYSGPLYHHVYPNNDEVSVVEIVYVSIYDGNDFAFNDGEVKEVRWFKEEELPKDISENHLKPLLDYFKKYVNSNK